MSKIAIKAENISKQYRLGEIGTGTISQDLNRWWHKVRGKEDPFLKIGESNDRSQKGETDFVWSLKDINFEINQGDTVGIIGRNGAGKSTLLKLLSKVTKPTTGQFKVNGRISSLLEVGTGFHPEMTGRENIYLNGAILGMRRSEIIRKFDEIVDFAGIERYIDTPVKRYSSGMYVRLAFAVAAHLESEILIVDEVLAVGDAEFQKKCLGKMGDLSVGQGRTVLFVSHNMNATKQLCKRGIFLENGLIKMVGEMNSVVNNYVYQTQTEKNFVAINVKEIGIVISNVTLNEQFGGLITPYNALIIDIQLECEFDTTTLGVEVMISHEDTTGLVFTSNSKTMKDIEFTLVKGRNYIRCQINQFNLCSGRYKLGIGLSLQQIKYYYYELDLLNFNVEEAIVPPSILPTSAVYGHVYLEHQWLKIPPA